jgi:hypothetical protein
LEWAKENFIFNGIYKQYGAGMRVVFDGTVEIWRSGGRSYLLIWALYIVLEQ